MTTPSNRLSITSAILLAVATCGLTFHQYFFASSLSRLQYDINRHQEAVTTSLEYGYKALNDSRVARDLRNHAEILKQLNANSNLVNATWTEIVSELRKSAKHAVLATQEAGYLQSPQVTQYYNTIESKTSYNEIWPILTNFLDYAEDGCDKIQQQRNDIIVEYIKLDSIQRSFWIGCLIVQTLAFVFGVFTLRQSKSS